MVSSVLLCVIAVCYYFRFDLISKKYLHHLPELERIVKDFVI